MAGYVQNLWRFYDDDATHSSSSAHGAELEEQTLDVDTNYQARQSWFGDLPGLGTKTFQWQYSHNLGAWTNITASSSVVKAVVSPHYSDKDDATHRLSGTWTPWLYVNTCALSGTGVTGAMAPAPPIYCENVLCFQLVAGEALPTDNVELRFTATSIVHQGTMDIVVAGTPSAGKRFHIIG
jgi:hypothetical protein